MSFPKQSCRVETNRVELCFFCFPSCTFFPWTAKTAMKWLKKKKKKVHLNPSKNSFPCSLITTQTKATSCSKMTTQPLASGWQSLEGHQGRMSSHPPQPQTEGSECCPCLTLSLWVTLSCLGWATELWPCSWGCQSSQLVTPSTDLISQLFSHNDENACVCMLCSHLLLYTYRWIYTHPPAKA